MSFLSRFATEGSGRWDMITGALNWRLWAFLGLQDIRGRYRRSSFGPLWLMLGLGVTVLGIGLLYSAILKTAPGNYVPFIAISLLTWTLISTTIGDATGLFQGAGGTIKSVKIPYSTFVLRSLVRNLIVAAHCTIVVIVAFVYYRFPVRLVALAAVPGFVLLFLNLYWISILLALLCARYRDAAQIIQYMLALALFLTPIIWIPTPAMEHSAVAAANPLFHLVEIVRGPIFEGRLPFASFEVCAGMLIAGFTASVIIFDRFRRSVIYWI